MIFPLRVVFWSVSLWFRSWQVWRRLATRALLLLELLLLLWWSQNMSTRFLLLSPFRKHRFSFRAKATFDETFRLKYNVRSNEAKWPQKSGWIKSHFWLSQPNQACDTIFSIRIWCSTTFSLTVWRNSAKWRFRQFFYPLFCGHLASFFRTSCFRWFWF